MLYTNITMAHNGILIMKGVYDDCYYFSVQ